MKDLSVDNLTTIKDLSKSDIQLIFNTADARMSWADARSTLNKTKLFQKVQ